jgi:hypothetical protein
MPQADDKKLGGQHEHLSKVCPMLARKQLGRMYVGRPLWKWQHALRTRRGGTRIMTPF